MEATFMPEKQQASSLGVLQKILIFLVVFAICVGFFVGLLLVTTRLNSLEEAVNGLSEVSKSSWGSNSNERDRRDTGSISLEDVRKEFQTQLSSITASQLCSPPDRICLAGLPGPKGEPGEEGTRGERGDVGAPGDDGYKGMKGLDGLIGKRGDKGIQGYPGMKGAKGDVGANGELGESGDGGCLGYPGDQGDPGQQGIPGVPGQKGEPGAKGEKGEHGISSLLSDV